MLYILYRPYTQNLADFYAPIHKVCPTLFFRVVFQQINQGPVNCAKNLKKLEKCLGKGDLEKLELNGKKIFKDLGDREKGRVGKVYGQRDCKYNNDIAETAFAIAESMKFDTADELMSITEIVVAEVRGNFANNTTGSKFFLYQFISS